MLFRILCILLVVVLTDHASIAKGKLIFAVDLVRHGDRTPCQKRQNMPGMPYPWSDSELCQLTELGIEQAELLGKQFKKYYIEQANLLPKNFQADAIHVQSSDTNRTKDTAKALLSGLYPNENTIDVASFPNGNDPLLMNQRRAQFSNEQKRRFQANEDKLKTSKKNVYKRARKALEKIDTAFGTNFSNGRELMVVADLADLIYVSGVHNKKGFEKLSKLDADEIIYTSRRLVLELGNDRKLYCIKAQNFVSNLANLFENALINNQQKTPKYVLYVGHDDNIISVTSLLGCPIQSWPHYLSDLRFEMSEGQQLGETLVKSSLNGHILKVCGADTCPAVKFIATLRAKVKHVCGEMKS